MVIIYYYYYYFVNNFYCVLLYVLQARIIKLVGEIDHAVEKHAKLQKENEQRRQQILDSKLKPKGHLLLKKPVNKVKKQIL